MIDDSAEALAEYSAHADLQGLLDRCDDILGPVGNVRSGGLRELLKG